MAMDRWNTNLDHFKFKSLAGTWSFETGLDEDGKLWAWTGQTQPPVRIGADSDWTSIACDNGRLVARKADGSLWAWIFDYRPWVRQVKGGRIKGDYAIATEDLIKIIPRRQDSHNDWLAVGNDPWAGVVTLAADGSLWQWWDRSLGQYGYPLFGLNLRPSRRPSQIANIFDN